MSEFGPIAQSESMQRAYQEVVDKINPTAHPDFLERPIKVLDIGGGTGEVGLRLKNACETVLGNLTPDDFAAVVDYVNLDIDQDTLRDSIGRPFHSSVANAYLFLQDEDPFDFCLSINPAPKVKTYTQADLDRIGIPREHGFIRENMNEASRFIAGQLAKMTLISAALLLAADGTFIQMGVISESTVQGIASASREAQLGLRIRASEKVELDEEVALQMVELDSRHKTGKKVKETVEFYRRNYRMLTIVQTGQINRPVAIEKFNTSLTEFADLASYQEAQERFWG